MIELIQKLFSKERCSLKPCDFYALDPVTAQEVYLNFDAMGGETYLSKNNHRRIITWGSEAFVYRWRWNGTEFVVKRAKIPSEQETYYTTQLAGQTLLREAGACQFAPIVYLEENGAIIQRFVEGHPGLRKNTVNAMLAPYGLTMSEPNPNAILSPLGIVIFDFSYIQKL